MYARLSVCGQLPSASESKTRVVADLDKVLTDIRVTRDAEVIDKVQVDVRVFGRLTATRAAQ